MELICNELSLYPLVKSSIEAEKLFADILKTFRVFKNKFGFNHIRFLVGFQNQQVTSSLTYAAWIDTISNKTLKDTVLPLFRQPFVDDLNPEELNEFFKSEYEIIHNDVPEKRIPIGLPIAHILNMPAISFNTHEFWLQRKINISKTNTSETENLIFSVYNICLESDCESEEFVEWMDISMVDLIDSVDVLKKYLSFTKYAVDFTEEFMKQLFEWKKEDSKTYKYTLLLMKDAQIHPFTGGMGRTENLKGRGKEASKRINIEDRLSYSLENNTITFVACKGHYEFH